MHTFLKPCQTTVFFSGYLFVSHYMRRFIECPFVSPFRCWVRSDAPSSTCKFITPLASKPRTNIRDGDTRGRQDFIFMQHMFPLPYLTSGKGIVLGVLLRIIDSFVRKGLSAVGNSPVTLLGRLLVYNIMYMYMCIYIYI